MNKKNIIYTLTTSLALALGSCASEDFWDTFDRTVDGPIDFTVGVESSPAERSLTRAITPKYTSMAKGTQVRIRVNGDWVKKTPNTTVSQTATCVTNEATEVNSLSYDNNTLYWDDYGAGDPDNSLNTANGLTVLGVAVDGKNEAPAVGDNQWDNLPWTVETGGTDVLKSDIIISNNLTTSPYTFANRNDDDAKKMVFTHPLSKITFNIKAGDGFTTGTVGATTKKFDKDPILTLSKATTLAGIETAANNYALATGTVSISGGSATSDNKTSKVIAGTVSTSDLAITVIKQAIVYPGTQLGANSSDIIAVLQADDNVYYINASEIHTAISNFDSANGVSHTDYKTLPGYNYIINIIVNKSCIILSASITDWVSVNSNEVNPEININATVGGGGDSELKNINKFTFWRSTKIDSGYDNVAQPEVKDDGSLDWTKTNVLYWTHHKQHYHFRGIYPISTVVVKDATDEHQYIEVGNEAYDKNDFPSNFVIGMPEIKSGTMCGNPDHKDEEVDMSVGGICARRVPINLNFRYMMSQVEVNLTSSIVGADDYVDLTYAEVELVNVGTAGNILLSDRSAKITTESNTYSLNSVSSSSIHYHDIIVPQTLVSNNSNKVKFKITVYSDDTKTAKDVYYADVAPIKVKKAGSTDEAAAVSVWESGVHYVYNLKITKTEIKATATLTDWQTVEASEDVWF